MTEQPQILKFRPASGHRAAGVGGRVRKVGVVDGAIGPAERLVSLAALFPHVEFESVGAVWPNRLDPNLDILIAAVSAQSAAEVDGAVARLKTMPQRVQAVIALKDADVAMTRRLSREGAADVLPAPVSEPALALCLERLLTRETSVAGHEEKAGEVVAMLKAGGGVGATALAVQTAILLASRGSGGVCLADLDLQFGAGALYLDLPDALTLADVISAGGAMDQTPFGEALPHHRSGVRVLAAPRDLMSLDSLSPGQIDSLLLGLKREFALTIVDLPAVWTAWTNQVLATADRIVLVTHLSVPHIQLANRQLRMLSAQHLDDRPILVVCNALSPDHTASVSIKAAERALERSFDVVIPEDRRTMFAAINQGVEIAQVRRGAKVEKAIGELANKMAGAIVTTTTRQGWR